MSSVRPSPDEARQYVVGPDSRSWAQASDIRSLLLAPYALILQVAHPTVGAGVAEHSNFVAEPWQRLMRTLDYLNLLVYGGDDAIETASRVREMHKRIKGARVDGTKYHALEPQAYAWVHATLMLAIVELHNRFIRRLSQADVEASYQEWLGLGRLLGIREGDLPPDWAGFQSYCDTMMREELVDNETVRLVVRTIRTPGAPPGWPSRLGWLWRLVRLPAGYLLTLTGASALTPELRKRFGIRWSPNKQRQADILAAISRAITPILPRRARMSGPTYLNLRRKFIARDEFAPDSYRRASMR
ncbi:oxygenase MpaB family protein [Haloechinothrix halophila]|uniref:oxygenase MpaB family protein n=1 Tax=Haloechinothrix halophila TaxID=1069073 RepID=UPI0003FF0321|nr:oxygenase MpaB family protein [Haloechinothrix halophila]